MKITHDAANPNFNYYGRWQRGKTAVSLNSGAMVEFVYLGDFCALMFDVRGFTNYPAIFVQVDNGPVAKTTLSHEICTVTVNPLYNSLPNGRPPFAVVSSNCHLARIWIAAHSLYQTSASGQQWTTLVGSCKFSGVDLKDGDLVPMPYMRSQIEFLGDSITQGRRILYTGVGDDTGQQVPHANWPQYTADMLGMKPIVTGFGGQGLTSYGTCGAPPANDAFPYVYNGVIWDPIVRPDVVVIYQGTNDSVSPAMFEGSYTRYLATVRKGYPSALVFATCPHNKTDYAEAIGKSVDTMRDKKILFLDYSSGVLTPDKTCDGCHLNPGGAVALAARFAGDIYSRL
jgi:lysophospholipase L1-like esterase